jgi:hypothetical protein
MTPAEIRLKILELARPDVSNPDVAIWVDKAAALEKWVMQPASTETPSATEGQADTPPRKRGSGTSRPKSGEPEFGPAF